MIKYEIILHYIKRLYFEFFSKLEHEKVYKALKKTNADSTDSYCTDECPYIGFSNFTIRKYDNLCEKLNKLISYLCFKEGRGVLFPMLNTNDYEYLNYWLNVELENNKDKFSEIKKELIQHMKNDANSCFNKDMFKEKLHHIEKSDFEYMNMLDNLYKDYAEISIMRHMGSSGQGRPCYMYSEKCYDNYELAIMKNRGMDTDFNKALQKFKETYASLRDDGILVYICDTTELKKLRSDAEILATVTKELSEGKGKNSVATQILVPTIGLTSSFIFLYMIDSIKQIPNIFSSRLDEPEKASNLNKLITSIASSSLSFVQHEENIKLLAQLARNIKLIVSEYPENYVKRCRDINYWFNEKIKTYKVITKEDIYSDSTAVFNDILWPKSNKKIVCVQNEKPYSPNNAKLMKELDDYCEIRDNNGCNALKNKNECLKYNSYISGKKKYFSSQIKNICSPPNCNEKDYKIDANCTLNDFDLTFPEINCEVLYKKELLQEPAPATKERSPLEIGFFIIVSFILFYLFILFLEKVNENIENNIDISM
ncbi:hypothetical protein PVNG_02848 [Plasmodium vivax North Korean]|uniref:VIR protein n=1 Tax=Plasmodium vivax North Korean TaxID=1035514 RepID=A0A0J9TL28_PLAVI|nr:hypothetical protein PVNG_02848 [Plasmodium vivax North Korean]